MVSFLNEIYLLPQLLSCTAPTMKVSVVKCDVETEEGHMVGNMFTNELTGSGGEWVLSLSLS